MTARCRSCRCRGARDRSGTACASHTAPARFDAARAAICRPACNVLTCGSVDDGKSTLIGRLLWDTSGLHADQRERLEQRAEDGRGHARFQPAGRWPGRRARAGHHHRHRLALPRHAGAPAGHHRQPRPRAVHAQHGDGRLARRCRHPAGRCAQRREGADAAPRGHPRPDGRDAGWCSPSTRWIWSDWSEPALRDDPQAISMQLADAVRLRGCGGHSGLRGARRQHRAALAGHALVRGPRRCSTHLVQHGRAPASPTDGAFRFPVQLVVRAGQDFRGLAGTVSLGQHRGRATRWSSRQRARARSVARIATMGRDLPRRAPGQAVVLELDSDLDISRGAVLARAGQRAGGPRRASTRGWCGCRTSRSTRERGYLLRTATDLVPIAAIDITRAPRSRNAERAAGLGLRHQRHRARLASSLAGRAAIDLFADQPETGSFVLVDPITGATGGRRRGHGRQRARERQRANGTFRLTRELLERGVGADLPPDRAPRRSCAAAPTRWRSCMREAGVAVEIEDTLGPRRHRRGQRLALADGAPVVRIRRRHPVRAHLRTRPAQVDRRCETTEPSP